LVVEDEPTVAQLIADVLRGDGHRVAMVLDSRAGLKLTGEQAFDLVICDLKMPRLDGRAFYHCLERARSRLLNRIIFVTGDTLAAQTMEFLEAHSLPYLAKPFLVGELKNAVERVFKLPLQKARAAGNSVSNPSSAETARNR
jgi:DNA-binding response OmpR family regulator